MTKLFRLAVIEALVDYVDKVVGQDKGHSFSTYSKLFLEVAQDVAKIDVKKLQTK